MRTQTLVEPDPSRSFGVHMRIDIESTVTEYFQTEKEAETRASEICARFPFYTEVFAFRVLKVGVRR